MSTPRFDTAFCRLVGIEHPIVQAPIGGLSTPELAAAVSNAGGLGMMALTWADEAAIDAALGRIRELTSQPFGINLSLDWQPSFTFGNGAYSYYGLYTGWGGLGIRYTLR